MKIRNWIWLFGLFTFLPVGIWAKAATSLDVSIQHTFDGSPLFLNSLRYKNVSNETYSFTRLSYLLDDFALQTKEGSWLELSESTAFIDLEKKRTHFTLTDIPSGEYIALRFAVGVGGERNHADPAQYPAKHPLNSHFNNLHWTWQTGYIFMALEGRYRNSEQSLEGYVYHFANDPNYTLVSLPLNLDLSHSALLDIQFELSSLFTFPNSISFQRDGDSTHSHPDDKIATSLKENLPSAFRVKAIRSTKPAPVKAPLLPIDLPEEVTPFPFRISKTFPRPNLPTDNPLIVERVALGKKLFFDTRLSHNNTVSCVSCHSPEHAFSDPKQFSQGVGREVTLRHSMPLFNLAWKEAFFWDGRVTTLREQVLHPIENPNEMGENLPHVIKKLSADEEYRLLFQAAFASGDITAENIGLALENFLLTLTSYQSKFDRAMQGKVELSDEEKRGFELFMTEFEPRSKRYGADCFHCHGGALFSDHQFHNNGLVEFDDVGRMRFTRKSSDRNKFSTPSLRNVAITAPYMHDGRFESLEAVLHHYNQGITRSETLDPNLAKHPAGGLGLSDEDIEALVAFLKALTDETF